MVYALFSTRRVSGNKLPYIDFYTVPIIVPFVAFLFDRAERFMEAARAEFAIDALVVGVSVSRMFLPVPFISGHALFLTYALLSSRSRIAHVTASLLMVQVVYLKYVVWHDFVTSTTGIILGVVATLFTVRIRTAVRDFQ